MPPERIKNHARRRLVVDLDTQAWPGTCCLGTLVSRLLGFLYPVCAISARILARIVAMVCGYGVLLCTYNERALRVYYMQQMDRERNRWLRCLDRTGASRRDGKIQEAH